MPQHLYRLCCSCIGKTARIRTRDGRVLTGRICWVTPSHVHLIPVGRPVNQENEKVTVQHALADHMLQRGTEIWFFGGRIIVPLIAIMGLTIVGTAPFWGGPF
ncbi:hypothetical protein J2S00_001734 [Caldalkalibacillus uzonensis]|uniref:Uncharacterized protein n=1 Tax=Caldalkalibacillus uzonensis TaxID=353224 RepID=A0ABU0CR96_9BACI|nr:hypothetical protein [Caldalkalibacillus uzonensis]MDQ0338948.1 hypothetical protein [Caldalkalibacillus uzonensis]